MNCDVCKQVLSAFLDGEIGENQAVLVRTHLAVCSDCAKVFEDLSSILFTCAVEERAEITPPDFENMRRRIINTIESETKPIQKSQSIPQRRFWSLSLPQLASAVLAIAIISSLLTVVAIRNYMQPATDDFTSRAMSTQTTFEKVLGKFGLIETPQQSRERHIKEQMTAIAYWDNRVQSRRVQWDARTREAFDRNLQVINESLDQYSTILQQDPEDELSVEMMDSVMNDKMSLLRDFSDL